ncbi:tRNA pseudouridine(55) synthase TruB [Patescibacteria group bacterium]
MLLLIDKPKGITSHDVVDELRKITGIKKIGHAGTLDPMAEGLLVVGIGRESTKKLGSIAKDTKKIYEAKLFLGKETDTYDADGKIVSEIENFLPPSITVIEKFLNKFKGAISQLPPKFSAIKIKGKKAYELARKGEEVKLEPRKITIYNIKILKYCFPILSIEIECSSGTYIRSLAYDIGKELGCGAHLSGLRRTVIGEFNLKNAVNLEKLTCKNWREYGFEITSL